MNRYNKHMYYKAVTNELLMGSHKLPTMNRKIELENMYKKKKQLKILVGDLLIIQEQKRAKEIKNIKYTYSDEDLSLLNELSCFDLTYDESIALNRTEEYRQCERHVYPNIKLNKKEEKEFDKELERLGNCLTLRLVYNKYVEIKKK